MKKTIGVILVLMMVMLLTACGGKTAGTSSQFRTETAERTNSASSDSVGSETEEPKTSEGGSHSVYGQDPFAVILGKYTAVEQRANAVVTSPAVDTLQIVITGSGSAANFAEWKLTGKLDDSLSLTFRDSVLRLLTYNENGEIINEETQYTDGSGTVVFDQDAIQFTWNDVKSGEGPVTFVLNQEQGNESR